MSSGVFTSLCYYRQDCFWAKSATFFDSGFAIRLFIKQFDLLYVFIRKEICDWFEAAPLEARTGAVGVVDSGRSVVPSGVCGRVSARIPLGS